MTKKKPAEDTAKTGPVNMDAVNAWQEIRLPGENRCLVYVEPYDQQDGHEGDKLICYANIALPRRKSEAYASGRLVESLMFGERLKLCGLTLISEWGRSPNAEPQAIEKVLPSDDWRYSWIECKADTWLAAIEAAIDSANVELEKLRAALQLRLDAWNSEGLEYFTAAKLLEK